jgi:TrpR-related protein YerC/YecD
MQNTQKIWQNNSSDALFQTVLQLRTLDEARRFFRDLLTVEEIYELANRWHVARLLDEKIPYEKIVAQTGMSSTTVARVQRWRTRGMGGYKRMLARTLHHSKPFSLRKGLG